MNEGSSAQHLQPEPDSQDAEGAESSKKPWESVTLWTSLLIAVAAYIPPVGVAIAANPGLAGLVAGVIVAALRMKSTKPVSLKKAP